MTPRLCCFCSNVEARDVDPYSMVRLTKKSEKEVVCIPVSAFRVSRPPTKTNVIVSVHTAHMQAPHAGMLENNGIDDGFGNDDRDFGS